MKLPYYINGHFGSNHIVMQTDDERIYATVLSFNNSKDYEQAMKDMDHPFMPVEGFRILIKYNGHLERSVFNISIRRKMIVLEDMAEFFKNDMVRNRHYYVRKYGIKKENV